MIEYTVIWSNEDGGTNTPSLMARWGRTTDIEWLYRVTVDANGNRISDAYQSIGHGTQAFDGIREDDHPLMQVVTSNNNMASVTDLATSSGYRFFLETGEALPANRAREAMMDAHPWSYLVMAKEMAREGQDRGGRRPGHAGDVRPAQLPLRRGQEDDALRDAAALGQLGGRGARGQGRRHLVHVAPRLGEHLDRARRPGGDDDRAPGRHDGARHRGDQGDRRARTARPATTAST